MSERPLQAASSDQWSVGMAGTGAVRLGCISSGVSGLLVSGLLGFLLHASDDLGPMRPGMGFENRLGIDGVHSEQSIGFGDTGLAGRWGG